MSCDDLAKKNEFFLTSFFRKVGGTTCLYCEARTSFPDNLDKILIQNCSQLFCDCFQNISRLRHEVWVTDFFRGVLWVVKSKKEETDLLLQMVVVSFWRILGNFHQQFGEDEFHFDLYCKSWGCFTKPKKVVSPNQKVVFGLAKSQPNPNVFWGIRSRFFGFSRGLLVPVPAVQATCLEEAIPVSERQNLVSWLLIFFLGFHFGKRPLTLVHCSAKMNIGSIVHGHGFVSPMFFFVLSEIGVSFASKWEANINFDSKKGKFGIQLSCWCDDWSPCWETFGSPKTGLPWKLGKTQMIFLPWKSATFDQITLYS